MWSKHIPGKQQFTAQKTLKYVQTRLKNNFKKKIIKIGITVTATS